MNESTAEGKFDQLKGKVKQGFGEAIGDESLANSGAADEVKGAAKETWGKTKDAFKGASSDANAHAVVHEEHVKHDAHETAHDVREKITSTAQNVKDSVTKKLDEHRHAS